MLDGARALQAVPARGDFAVQLLTRGHAEGWGRGAECPLSGRPSPARRSWGSREIGGGGAPSSPGGDWRFLERPRELRTGWRLLRDRPKPAVPRSPNTAPLQPSLSSAPRLLLPELSGNLQ